MNRLGSVRTWRGVTIFPTLVQAALRKDPVSLCSFAPFFPPGKPSHDGTVNTAHHIPERPTARHKEEVDPSPRVTGTMRTASAATPEKHPKATFVEESREVVSESRA